MASSSSTSSLLRKQAVAPVLNVCVWCARLWLGISKRVGPLERVFQRPHPLYGVLWRCPTLPHPPRCSTIGACGLSFQVRNGDWAFPRGYDHHKMVQPVFTFSPRCCFGGCVGCDPHSGDEHFIVSVNHTVYTFVVEVFVSVGPLVPVGSRAPRGASTSGLSTR